MAAIGSLLVVLVISLLITRVATMALVLTGMSREAARFQARSAFTGVGYTTSEAEDIVAHPVRRQILMLLMLLSNLGVGAVVATVMVSFMETKQAESVWPQMLLLVTGLFLLWITATSRRVERYTNRLIALVLRRWAKLQIRDYVAILQLQDGYAVSELYVEPRDWLTNRTLIDLKLPHEGVLILGIRRAGGAFLGTPTGDMKVLAGDTLILYGPVDRIRDLDCRSRGSEGDLAHAEAIAEQREELTEQVQLNSQIEGKNDAE